MSDDEDIEVVPILKRAFKSLVDEPGFVGLYLLPFTVLAIVFFHAWTALNIAAAVKNISEIQSLLIENAVWIILYIGAFVILGLIAFAGIILKAKARENGKRIGFVKSIRKGSTYAPTLFLIFILVGIIIFGPFLGLILLEMMGLSIGIEAVMIIAIGAIIWLLPMIYLGVRLSLVVQACIIEDLGPVKSLKTSWRTTSGNFWLIFVTGLLLGIISIAITIIPRIISPTIGQAIGSLIAGAIVGPAGLIAYTIIYLKLSERR